MVKATKRSRKFNAKTAGGRGGDVSTKKKGKAKQHGGKSSKQQLQHDNDSNNDNDGGKKKKARQQQQEELEKLKNERDAKDFTNLGTLNIESFFEKAVDGLEDEEEITHDNNKNDDIDEGSDDDDDDEGSIDSYASILGSSSSNDEDEDIEASEKQLRDQLAKLGEDDPEFHKYLKEVRVTRYTMRALVLLMIIYVFFSPYVCFVVVFCLCMYGGYSHQLFLTF